MPTLFVAPQLGMPSETFIARHYEYLYSFGRLVAHIVPGIILDSIRSDIPVISLGKRRLRPVYERAWRSVARRLGLSYSSWYSVEVGMVRLLRDHPVSFDRVLIEYADHAYSNHIHINQWLANKLMVVIHFHGYDAVASNFPDDYISILRGLAEKGAVFVANSEFTKKTIAHWNLPEDRLVVKCYGVEIPVKVRHHHTDSRVTILHLGRLVDFKAPDLTIKAFEIACELGLDGNLIVAGDGELKERCRTLYEKSKWKERITLLGPVDWVRAEELRLSADIFTLHSVVGESSGRVENLGVAVLEAMANGLPVVTCAMGGITETVVDGETGIFFPTTDVEAQANAFLELARSPELRQKLGIQGRARVIEHFSIEREKRELLRLLGYTDA